METRESVPVSKFKLAVLQHQMRSVKWPVRVLNFASELMGDSCHLAEEWWEQ